MSSFADSTVRIDKLIYIPGAVVDPESLPDTFRDFCELDGDEAIFEQLPSMEEFRGGDDFPEPYDVAMALCEVPGFLVLAETPVIRRGGCYSWGYTSYAWLYAETAEDIERVACVWADEQHNKDTAEHAA